MPFDGSDFPRKPPPRASGAKPSDNLICAFIIVLAFSLLVLPISLNSLADIVRFINSP